DGRREGEDLAGQQLLPARWFVVSVHLTPPIRPCGRIGRVRLNDRYLIVRCQTLDGRRPPVDSCLERRPRPPGSVDELCRVGHEGTLRAGFVLSFTLG